MSVATWLANDVENKLEMLCNSITLNNLNFFKLM